MNKTEFISAIAEKAELSSFHRRSGRRTEER